MTYPELRCDLSGPELLLPRQQERLHPLIVFGALNRRILCL